MKMNRDGFTLVEALLIIVVVAIIGTVSYVAYDRIIGNPASDTSQNNGNTQKQEVITADDLPESPEITKKADLGEAISIMDSVDLDSSSDAQLDEIQAEMDKF